MLRIRSHEHGIGHQQILQPDEVLQHPLRRGRASPRMEGLAVVGVSDVEQEVAFGITLCDLAPNRSIVRLHLPPVAPIPLLDDPRPIAEDDEHIDRCDRFPRASPARFLTTFAKFDPSVLGAS